MKMELWYLIKIAETVIRVDRRMSYNQVRCILEDGDTETSREYKDLVPMFFLMKELSALLRRKKTPQRVY